MENLKKFFEENKDNVVTFEQFNQFCTDNKIKLADLSTGEYVSKAKHDDIVNRRDETIKKLEGDLTTRDTDLENLKEELTKAGNNADSLKDVTKQFETLQEKYNKEVGEYKDQLAKQAYEFAVKEFANGKKFTSKAAKRDFINSMLTKELKMENDKILGAEDFVTEYTKENDDAFVKEDEPGRDDPKPNPRFVNPPKSPNPPKDNPFNFNFLGVRPHNTTSK